MNPQKHTMSILAQIASWIPDRIIENLAKEHKIQTRSFSATSHVISMVYAHLAHALSLNDICDSLSNHAGTLAQIRNCTPPSRNGLSHANMTRNAGMAEELFWKVYESLSRQHPEFLSSSRNYPGLPYRFRRTVRAVDSTTIQLTAFSMGWAKHRRRKAAAKMHTALNMRSFLPNFVIVKSAHDSDPKTAWELCADMKAGEVVVFDKAYVDFKHLKTLSERGVSWVTRSKDNMLHEVVGQQVTAGEQKPAAVAPAPAGSEASADAAGKDVGQQASGKRRYVRKKCKILSDEHIRLTGVKTTEHYPEELRLVTAEVEIKGKMVEMTFHHQQLRMVGVHHLPALPVPMGRGGVLQGNQADASAGGLPRLQRKRRALAGMDGFAYVSAAALCRLAQQMEAPVQQAVHFGSCRPVELLQAGQHYRMLRYRQRTEEEGHQGQP